MDVLEKILEEISERKRSHEKDIEIFKQDDDFDEYLIALRIDELEVVKKIIRKHMTDVSDNGGWIPLEERPPEDGESVLCCSDDERMMIGVLHKEYYIDFGIAVAENYNQIMHGVIAWQSLPEPYRPERGHEE